MAEYTDDFAGSGALSGNWTTGTHGTIQRTSGQAEPATGSGTMQSALYTGSAVANDQFSEVVVGTGSASGGYLSYVFVRGNYSGTGSTTEGVGVQYGDGIGEAIIRIDDGVITVLQTLTGVTTAAGDIWKVVVAGDTLSAWKNGTQEGTNQDISGLGFTSGSPGIGGGFAGYDVFASWRGGDGNGVGGGGNLNVLIGEPITGSSVIN